MYECVSVLPLAPMAWWVVYCGRTGEQLVTRVAWGTPAHGLLPYEKIPGADGATPEAFGTLPGRRAPPVRTLQGEAPVWYLAAMNVMDRMGPERVACNFADTCMGEMYG